MTQNRTVRGRTLLGLHPMRARTGATGMEIGRSPPDRLRWQGMPLREKSGAWRARTLNACSCRRLRAGAQDESCSESMGSDAAPRVGPGLRAGQGLGVPGSGSAPVRLPPDGYRHLDGPRLSVRRVARQSSLRRRRPRRLPKARRNRSRHTRRYSRSLTPRRPRIRPIATPLPGARA